MKMKLTSIESWRRFNFPSLVSLSMIHPLSSISISWLQIILFWINGSTNILPVEYDVELDRTFNRLGWTLQTTEDKIFIKQFSLHHQTI